MRATFSCNVSEIAVKEEQEVSEGDKLVVVEAMKMQNEINSPKSGKIKKILINYYISK